MQVEVYMIPGTGPGSSPKQQHPNQEKSDPLTQQVSMIARSAILKGAEVTPIDPKRFKVEEETFVSAWEFTDLGDHWTCTQKFSDDELNLLNGKQFPATQKNFERMMALMGEPDSKKANFLKNFGFAIDPQTKTLTIPKKNTLEQKLENYREQHPSFPELKMEEASEIVAPAEFLKILLENDVIISDPPELIHDLSCHIIPLLLSIFENQKDYKPFREKTSSSLTIVAAELEKAKTNFEIFIAPVNQILKKRGQMPIKRDEWSRVQDLLEFSLSGCIDNLTGDIYKFILFKNHNRLLFDLQLFVIQGSRTQPWQEVWKKALNLSPEQFAVLKKIADSERTRILLLALYVPQISALVKQLEKNLEGQTDLNPVLKPILEPAFARLPVLLFSGEKLDLDVEVGEILLHLLIDEASKQGIPVDYPLLRQDLCGIFENAEIPVKPEPDPIFQKVTTYTTQLLEQFKAAEQDSEDFLQELNKILDDNDKDRIEEKSWNGMREILQNLIQKAADQLTGVLIQGFTQPNYKPDRDKQLSDTFIGLVSKYAESALEEESEIVIDTLCAIFSKAGIPVDFREGGM